MSAYLLTELRINITYSLYHITISRSSSLQNWSPMSTQCPQALTVVLMFWKQIPEMGLEESNLLFFLSPVSDWSLRFNVVLWWFWSSPRVLRGWATLVVLKLSQHHSAVAVALRACQCHVFRSTSFNTVQTPRPNRATTNLWNHILNSNMLYVPINLSTGQSQTM